MLALRLSCLWRAGGVVRESSETLEETESESDDEKARHRKDKRKAKRRRYRAKGKERARLKEEEEKLKRLLCANDSLHHGKALCFHDTRVRVLQMLERWALDNAPDAARLFWLFGVAGCGKSAVAASIAQDLDDAGRLTGSFF